ncbi:MAG: hypothetical protein U1F33_13425 [Alphaproteobacteria bacterium]
MKVMRGAIPSPRHELAAAIPHVAIAKFPPTKLYFPKELSVWHNDAHGDCVTAEEAFAKACHVPEIFITDNEVETWAKAHGVYEGAIISNVLHSMRKHGFDQGGKVYDDGAAHSVNWTDPNVLRSAIYHGPVKIGVAANQLETTCAAHSFKTGWFASGYSADAKEDHCVSLCGYGTIDWLAKQLKAAVPSGVDTTQQAYALFTWGCIGIIDVPSMLAITHEAWLRTPTTVIM